MLELLVVARGGADTLVDRRILAAVEERPHKVDADGDDDQRVDRDGVGVETDCAVSAGDGADESACQGVSDDGINDGNGNTGTHPTMAIIANQV